MFENIYVRIDGKVHLLDYVNWDKEKRCLLYYVFDREEPYSNKEHKIKVLKEGEV